MNMVETIEILKDLIRIPSFVDEKHDESKVCDYVVNFIKTKTKYKYILQEVEGNRKNILVYNKPKPKIALFGHMDTVLPKTETDKPFEPKIEGNKLYGLGSVDMKSGLAIMLKLAAEVDNDELGFVFSVDEEYDFKGALKLKEIDNFHPEYIVNVEPTDAKILNGCRGITEFSFKVHGKSAHAGRKEYGVNAIEKAVELVNLFQKQVTDIDIPDGGKTSVNLAYLHGGMLKDNGDGTSKVSGLGNVVPNYAEVTCEIRIANPAITEEFVQKQIELIADGINLKVNEFKFKFYLGSMLTPKNELGGLEESIKESGEKVEYSDMSLAGYYEVQMLQEAWGSKCVVYGVSPIGMSHTADEYVQISSLGVVESVIRRFLEKTLK